MPEDTNSINPLFQPAGSSSPSGSHNHKGTIFVVEDEPLPRRVARTLLSRNGYQVLDAANASEALAVWERHRAEIDIIFADMEIPGELSGLQFCQRAMAEKQGVKVILTSGYFTPDLEQVSNAPICYLPKPSPPEKLLEVIASCLRSH